MKHGTFRGVRCFGKKSRRVKAQAVLEFTTASIIFIMLAFGLVQILRWAPGMLYEKTDQHDACMKDSDMSTGCLGSFSAPSIKAAMP